MKKTVALLLCLSVLLLSACGAKPADTRPAETAAVTPAATGNVTPDENGDVTLSFDEQPVNTVEISLDKPAASLVRIVSGGKTVYEREGEEQNLFCAFKTVRTDSLTVHIETSATVKSVTPSHQTSDNREFRVTAYAVAESLLADGVLTANSFDVVTDVILFGCLDFDENGELAVDAPLLEAALERLKSAVGDRDVRIYVNVLGPDSNGEGEWEDQMHDKADRHNRAFKTGKLETAIPAVLDEYGFDGVFFDYEYPLRGKDWQAFSDFLGRLRTHTQKVIGLALAGWALLPKSAQFAAVDRVELMQYDLFDDNGNHSSLQTCVDGAVALDKVNYPLAQADMGLPFYGRPADKSAEWPLYADYVDRLGTTKDAVDTDEGKIYFNCRQTVYDKTAYALSRGMGGMMVWHYALDFTDVTNGNSLFGAIGECLADRVTAD